MTMDRWKSRTHTEKESVQARSGMVVDQEVEGDHMVVDLVDLPVVWTMFEESTTVSFPSLNYYFTNVLHIVWYVSKKNLVLQ